MAKITFMGAGSTVFAKNLLGDCLLVEALRDAEIALYDIDGGRLSESQAMLDALNLNINRGCARIAGYLGVEQRRQALAGADYVVNAIQVGGYEPATVMDFEVPKRYGLRQTIGDTLGIGGIFRGLRTIPVCLDFARDMADVCPDAWFLNYVNPMAIVTGAILRTTGIRTVGLCHSVQVCARRLLKRLGMWDDVIKLHWKIAGINHQAWLLEIVDEARDPAGRDLYPEIRRRAAEMNRIARQPGAAKHDDMVRFEMMRFFGYYNTESSEHTAEYLPYWIKSGHPELIDEFNIPLDEYPRRCVRQIEQWSARSSELVANPSISHQRTDEYASYMIEAMETGGACQIGGNILNNGLITNLPARSVVEVPCLVGANGIQGCYVGELPEQLAAINRTNINVQLLTIEAALNRDRDRIYQAAALDPHTSAELTLDQVRALCDELIEAHGLREFAR